MKAIAMIPARYAATRFPFKLMQLLGGMPVISHTWQNTIATGLFHEVYVVTDNDLIYNEITSRGGKAVMSLREHESGSDRIAEASQQIEADVILNVQGDEPFINRNSLARLLEAFNDPNVRVASLMRRFKDPALLNDPNYVKVVVDAASNSLLFSRSPIPYHRDKTIEPVYYEHIGVYAFRKESLMQFTKWPITPLEAIEKIECLRYLEHGIPLKMIETNEETVKIDVPGDLTKAEAYLKTYTK